MFYFILYFLVFCYLLNKLTCGKCNSKICLVGKTAIVTGANSGIGYTTAVDLASRGCRVILAGRDKTEKARIKIIKETNNANIVAKTLYLESFKSVRKFADEINKSEEKIDILIHNAGTGAAEISHTEDKLPFLMQVNYFSPFLLTHLLIEKLKKSEDPRIIFVSTLLYVLKSLKLETINTEKNSGYFTSKFCQVIGNKVFAEKLKPLGITVNALHPGIVRTGATSKYRANNYLREIVTFLIEFKVILLGKSPEEGAQTTIHLATSDKVKNVTGKYFMDCVQVPVLTSKVNDKSYCEKLWKLSEELTGLKDDEKL